MTQLIENTRLAMIIIDNVVKVVWLVLSRPMTKINNSIIGLAINEARIDLLKVDLCISRFIVSS